MPDRRLLELQARSYINAVVCGFLGTPRFSLAWRANPRVHNALACLLQSSRKTAALT